MTDAELVTRWESFMLAQGRAELTLEKYRYAIFALVARTHPPKSLEEMTEQDVVVFLARLGKRAHSKQLYLRAFKSLFTYATERGLMGENPAVHIRPKAPNECDPDAFSPEEVAALIAAAGRRDPKRALAIQACYALGLRRSEVCGIAPEDVDWNGHRVEIRHAKGDKPRWVPMNEQAEHAIRNLEPYWTRTVLGGMDPQWFTMVVNRAATDAGLPPNRRRAHMLRSAFVTHLLDAGCDVTVVSKLVGHSQLSTTMRYRAIRDQNKRDAVDRLPMIGRDM